MFDNLCHISNFQERDIDLLLAEELRMNNAFATWFTNQVAHDVQVEVPAFRTRVSVVEDGSESDVIACFHRKDGGIHRIFIEDKITASMMPEQLERYQRRAAAEYARNENQSFSVVLFAPESYRALLPDGVAHVTFGEAAAALDQSADDPRAAYKASFLRAAHPYYSPGSRDRHVAEVEPYVVEWWDAVYEMLDREFPSFFLTPRTRYPRSVYFAPRTSGMADYIRVDFKGHAGEVDLAIKNAGHSELAEALSGLDLPGRLVKNGKSSAIRVDGLSKFVISDGFSVIETDVRAAYAATVTLLEFWKANRGQFDNLVR